MRMAGVRYRWVADRADQAICGFVVAPLSCFTCAVTRSLPEKNELQQTLPAVVLALLRSFLCKTEIEHPSLCAGDSSGRPVEMRGSHTASQLESASGSKALVFLAGMLHWLRANASRTGASGSGCRGGAGCQPLPGDPCAASGQGCSTYADGSGRCLRGPVAEPREKAMEQRCRRGAVLDDVKSDLLLRQTRHRASRRTSFVAGALPQCKIAGRHVPEEYP